MIGALHKARATGGTFLLDAVAKGAQYARQGRNRKRALIIFSDGGDSFATRFDVEHLLSQVPELEILLYTIKMDSPASFQRPIAATEIEKPGAPRDIKDIPMPEMQQAIALEQSAHNIPEFAQRLMESLASGSGARTFSADATKPQTFCSLN